MTFVIAEISNQHFGSVEKAKQLIEAAKEAGADAVKGQAFDAEDMLKWGTMPLGFYKKCALRYNDYRELIKWGDEIGCPVFFTILSRRFSFLKSLQKYQKIHAADWDVSTHTRILRYDTNQYFISMKAPRRDIPNLMNAKIMYATEYMQDADLNAYELVRKFYQREVGVSHHGKECDELFEIHKAYKLPYVEKHFYLGDDIKYEGVVYRDCLHAYDPGQFKEFARRLKE